MKTFAPLDIQLLLHPKKSLQWILKTAVHITRARSGSILLVNPNTGLLEIEATHGRESAARKVQIKMGEGITGWVASRGAPARVGDVRLDRRYINVSKRARSELAVPLEQSGHVIGVLNVDSPQVNAFSEKEEIDLTTWAREAMDWLQVVWKIQQLRIKAQQLEALVDMGQAIVSQDVLEHVLKRVAQEAGRLMKARLSSIMLLSEDGEELSLAAWHGASPAYIKKPNLQVADSLVGIVVRRQKPLAVLNVQEHSRYQHTELARREGLVSFLSVPLAFKGQVLGALCVYTGQLHRFSNEEIRLLNAMAGLAAVVIAKTQLVEKMARVEEELKASERLSALGWLAAEIAHEIRNPLTVLQMLFHSFAHHAALNKTAARDVVLIQNKMKQMNRIVEQALTFAQSSEPSMEIINVNAMMDDLTLLIRHKLAEQKISIKRSALENVPPIWGDRTQLEQAILNLVMNACHAMPHGGALTLSARFQPSTSSVLLAIKDTGEGIPKARQKNLFQPFTTYRKGGTGLGLALVKKTIDQHRGSISFKSYQGKGTAFFITLPVGEPHAGRS
ncbi:MAG: GAF domain-containing protein [bacterium]